MKTPRDKKKLKKENLNVGDGNQEQKKRENEDLIIFDRNLDVLAILEGKPIKGEEFFRCSLRYKSSVEGYVRLREGVVILLKVELIRCVVEMKDICQRSISPKLGGKENVGAR